MAVSIAISTQRAPRADSIDKAISIAISRERLRGADSIDMVVDKYTSKIIQIRDITYFDIIPETDTGLHSNYVFLSKDSFTRFHSFKGRWHSYELKFNMLMGVKLVDQREGVLLWRVFDCK